MTNNKYDPNTYNQAAQEYARAAINAAFLLNGGAMVAVTAQLSSLLSKSGLDNLVAAMWMWAVGVIAAALSYFFGFLSARWTAEGNLDKSNLYAAFVLALLAVSLTLFLVGGYWSSDILLSKNQ